MAAAELAGRTAVVTGATSGIGEVVSRELARRGARVVVVGRSPERLAATLASLPPPAQGEHVGRLADLSRLAEMRRLAAEIAAAEPSIDLLINNAAGMFPQRKVTEDGWERTFATNHMAYFVLTLGLLDRVRAAPAGRVVVTASRMHASYSLDFDDLQNEKTYSTYLAYGRSKLCNILFARALARRLEGTGVTCNALHPGFVATRFGDDDTTPMGVLFRWAKVIAMSPEDGAKTTLHAATSAEGGRLNGAYFVKSRPAQPSVAARNDADGERLWEISARLAGLTEVLRPPQEIRQ